MSAKPEITVVLSIDTEEDNWEPARSSLSTENVRELPAFALFLEGLGVRPTYFVNYQIAVRPWAADIVAEITAGGRGEIGAHLHPWNTPPFDPVQWPGDSMLANYSPEGQRAKLNSLTEAIHRSVGELPTTFRAGRFGLGQETVGILIAAGYRVDSSVTPFYSWQRFDRGPDFTRAPLDVYRLDGSGDVRRSAPGGALVEVPVSAGFTRFSMRRWHQVLSVIRAPLARAVHLPGVLSRVGGMRRSMLSPETSSARDMIAVGQRIVEGGVPFLHLVLHSSSLRPGLSEFTHSRDDISELYDRLEQVIQELGKVYSLRFRTVGEYGAERLQRADASGAAHVRAVVTASRRTTAAARRRPLRLLAVNYHGASERAFGASGRWAAYAKHLTRQGWEVHLVRASLRRDDLLEAGVQVHLISVARTGTRSPAAPVAAGVDQQPPSSGGAASGPGRRSAAVWLATALQPLRVAASTLRAAWQIRQLVRRFDPDVIVTSGPPHSAHLAGLGACMGFPVPRVVDLEDAWWGQPMPPSPVASNYARGAGRIAPLVERLTFGSAALIIANSDSLSERMRSLYPNVPVLSLGGGFDIERVESPGRLEPFTGLAVACVGDFRSGRSLEPIVEAFRKFLNKNQDAAGCASKLRVLGPPELIGVDYVARLLADRDLAAFLEFHSPGSVDAELSLFRRSNAAIVLAGGQTFQVPACLYDLAELGIPCAVVGQPGSAADAEARRLGSRTLQGEDVDAIVRYLNEVWSGQISPPQIPRDLADYSTLAVELQRMLEIVSAG